MKDFDQVIKLLQEYKEQHGDCLVPQAYVTEDRIRLGSIVKTIRSGARKTSEAEKAMLDSLGFVWNARESVLSFEEVMKLLQEYKEQHGDCLVPQSYVTEDGIRLGFIVHNIRGGSKRTSAKEKEMLDNLGFAWKARESPLSFEEVMKLLQEYKEQHGDCLVPKAYVTEDGIRLGSIVNTIRSGARKTSEAEKAMLDSLGFVWKVIESPLSFEEVMKLLQEYKEQYGNCLVPMAYITEDGIRLGNIVHNIRRGDRKTSVDEKEMLDSLGFVWKVNISFEEVIILLQEYKEQHGNCRVPYFYVTEDGIRLGQIVSSIRSGKRKTSVEEKAKLDSLGFVWQVRKGRKN